MGEGINSTMSELQAHPGSFQYNEKQETNRIDPTTTKQETTGKQIGKKIDTQSVKITGFCPPIVFLFCCQSYFSYLNPNFIISSISKGCLEQANMNIVSARILMTSRRDITGMISTWSYFNYFQSSEFLQFSQIYGRWTWVLISIQFHLELFSVHFDIIDI